ncbi:MAG TPA: amino acid permease [Sphingomicrobium sp.]|jgi:APA family basic amino acid/polyamine antiporter|nr:amino acid permease [Sphingomicrobium sp.]
MSEASRSHLLGPVMSIAMVVGLIIGAGIFLLPASIAPFGVNMFVGWAITIGGFLALAFAFSALAARVDGGPYEYVKGAFGEEAAFLTNWSYLVSCWSAGAALAVAMAGALARATPALSAPGLVAPLSIAAVVLITAIACTGARSAGGTQVVTTGLKLVPLLLVVLVVGAILLSGGEAQPLAATPVNGDNVASVAAIMAFSLLGFEAAAFAAGKTADARKTVPIATMAGTAVTGLIYVLACTAVVLLVPLDRLSVSTQPFADAIAGSLGEGAGMLIALFVAISAIGALNANVLITGEIGYDMGRDRSVPAALGRSNRFGMPTIALAASSAITILLIFMNSSRTLSGLFTFMVLLTTVSSLFLYAVVALVAMKAPLHGMARALVFMAFLFALWTIYGAGLEAFLWGLALVAAGWPVRWLSRRFNSSAATPAGAAPAAPPGSSA